MGSLKYFVLLAALTLAILGMAIFFLKDVIFGTEGQHYGKPLYLTPYITAKRLQEAKKLSRVSIPDFPEVPSYSGFLTVNETHDSNMFFWYFPSKTNPDDPVILWLQGGPGMSSLHGLFVENGPFEINEGKLEPRPTSWTKNHHMIYIDNPVNTGYSHTKSGFAENQDDIGRDLYSALSQFFQLFPGLRDNEFYVSGESYGGKFVCAVCSTIHRENRDAQQKINLQGFSIGNGWLDPENQLMYADYLYQIGLVDLNGFELVSEYEKNCVEKIKEQDWPGASEIYNKLFNGFESLFYNLTNFENIYNFLNYKEDPSLYQYIMYVQQPKIRNALHVSNLTFYETEDLAMSSIANDTMQSVANLLEEILSHYRGIVYNGQLDIIVPYTAIENVLWNLNFSSASEWKEVERKPWYVGPSLAGYWKTAGNLTEVMVRNAGHLVPVDQPQWMENLINKLTRKNRFDIVTV